MMFLTPTPVKPSTNLNPHKRYQQVYTGIGSREAPSDITELATKLAQALAYDGWDLWSGGADGMDTAFEVGARLAGIQTPDRLQVFLPWKGFNGANPHDPCYVDVRQYPTYQKAMAIAATVHPVWKKLTRGPQALHTRNVYQILGPDLQYLTRAVICWAVPIKDGTAVKGGTATAVALARQRQIPVFNLYYDTMIQRAMTVIERKAI